MTSPPQKRLVASQLADFVANHVWAGPYVWYSIHVLGFSPSEIVFVWSLGFLAAILAQLPSSALASSGRSARGLLALGAFLQAFYCAAYAVIPTIMHALPDESARMPKLVLAVVAEIACGVGRPLVAAAVAARKPAESKLLTWCQGDGVVVVTGILRTVGLILAINGMGASVFIVAAVAFVVSAFAALTLHAPDVAGPASLRVRILTYRWVARLLDRVLLASSRTMIRAISLLGRHSELPKALGLTAACRCLYWAHLCLWFFMAKDLYGLAMVDGSTWFPDVALLGGVWIVAVAIGTGVLRPRERTTPSSHGIALLLVIFALAIAAECIIPYRIAASVDKASTAGGTQLHALACAVLVAGLAEGGLRARVPVILRKASTTDSRVLEAIESLATTLAAFIFLGFAALAFEHDPTGCWIALAVAALFIAVAAVITPIDRARIGPEGLSGDKARLRYRVLALLIAVGGTTAIALSMLLESGAAGGLLATGKPIEAVFTGLTRPGAMGMSGLEANVFSERWTLSNLDAVHDVRCRVTLRTRRLELLELDPDFDDPRKMEPSVRLATVGDDAELTFLIPKGGEYSVAVPRAAMSRPRCLATNSQLQPQRLLSLAYKNNPPQFEGGDLMTITVVALLAVLGMLVLISQQHFSRVRRRMDEDKERIFRAISDPRLTVGDLREMALGAPSASDSRRMIESAFASMAASQRFLGLFGGSYFGTPWQAPNLKAHTFLFLGVDERSSPDAPLTSSQLADLRTAIELLVEKVVLKGQTTGAKRDHLPVTTVLEKCDVECSTSFYRRTVGASESRRLVAFGGLIVAGGERTYVGDAEWELLQAIESATRSATEQALTRHQTEDSAHTEASAMNGLLGWLDDQANALLSLEVPQSHRAAAINRDIVRFIQDRQIVNHQALGRELPAYAKETLKLAVELEAFLRSRMPNLKNNDPGAPALIASGRHLNWQRTGDWPTDVALQRSDWVVLQTALLNVIDNVIKYAAVEEDKRVAILHVALLQDEKAITIQFRNRRTTAQPRSGRGYGLAAIDYAMRGLGGSARAWPDGDDYFIELLFLGESGHGDP